MDFTSREYDFQELRLRKAIRISEKKSLKKNETENFCCLNGLQTKLEEPIESRTKGGIQMHKGGKDML
jgi:hypothetical protein